MTKQELEDENRVLKQWITDLQSGMYVNCVYCGHRYGPKEKTPPTNAEMLKKHIATCPKHPLAEALSVVKKLFLVVEDFMPNLSRCALQNYQRLNEGLIEGRALLSEYGIKLK